MLDRGITGSKEKIVETLLERANQSKKAVDESLASVSKTFKVPTAEKALTQVKKFFEKADVGIGREAEIARVEELLGKNKFTLSEVNEVKRMMDKVFNIYKSSGEVSAQASAP